MAPLPSKFMTAAAPTAATEPAPEYYILRGYTAGSTPLSSIMDLPKDEAVSVMEKTQPHRGKGPADAQGHRDQNAYYDDRAASETWLRDNVSTSAGAEHPVYFALTNDPERLLKLMSAHAGPDTVIMFAPVTPATAARLSVTSGDSMGNHYFVQGYKEDGKTPFLDGEGPLTGKVMTVGAFARAEAEKGFSEAEAQYWSREPLPGAQTVRAADVNANPAISPLLLAVPAEQPAKTPVAAIPPKQNIRTSAPPVGGRKRVLIRKGCLQD